MNTKSLADVLSGNSYPGRGIIAGVSDSGQYAAAVYFIMGRSANSRNRIFVPDGDGIRTEAFDPSKVEDPSLILYTPVRVLGTDMIITNGDQTDTIAEGLQRGETFGQSLRSRTFEPDAPHYTPRISALLDVRDGHVEYRMSILKTADGDPSSCERFTYDYAQPQAGTGHFLHTYRSDGSPLPSFEGEPVKVGIPDGIDAMTELVWEHLNADNRVSLFVRYIRIGDGSFETRIVNRNKEENRS